MIRKAQLEDIERIAGITMLCAKNMINNDIFQWNDIYPTLEILKEDIDAGQLYIIKENTTLVGCIVISAFQDEIYKKVAWESGEGKHLYIHRLAVHPDFQGKGYAQKLMDFAEERGRNDEIISIRLDTFSQNPRNQKFYEQRGYKRLEDIYFPMQSKFPFYC